MLPVLRGQENDLDRHLYNATTVGTAPLDLSLSLSVLDIPVFCTLGSGGKGVTFVAFVGFVSRVLVV